VTRTSRWPEGQPGSVLRAKTPTPDYAPEKLQEAAKLAGGVDVSRRGAATEGELKERSTVSRTRCAPPSRGRRVSCPVVASERAEPPAPAFDKLDLSATQATGGDRARLPFSGAAESRSRSTRP